MSQSDPANQPHAAIQADPTIPYREEEPNGFSDALQQIPWKENKDLGGISLITECPACGHTPGIDVFLPTNFALWADEKTKKLSAQFKKAAQSGQFAQCQCEADHKGRPATVTGCGRWGMVTPKLDES